MDLPQEWCQAADGLDIYEPGVRRAILLYKYVQSTRVHKSSMGPLTAPRDSEPCRYVTFLAATKLVDACGYFSTRQNGAKCMQISI